MFSFKIVLPRRQLARIEFTFNWEISHEEFQLVTKPRPKRIHRVWRRENLFMEGWENPERGSILEGDWEILVVRVRAYWDNSSYRNDVLRQVINSTSQIRDYMRAWGLLRDRRAYVVLWAWNRPFFHVFVYLNIYLSTGKKFLIPEIKNLTVNGRWKLLLFLSMTNQFLIIIQIVGQFPWAIVITYIFNES